MTTQLLIGITSVIVLGMAAQWTAWRLRLPSILLLLLIGFLAGPVTGLLEPDALLGNLLFPIVSISVAIILFEGGLSLRLAELREVGKVVRNLITVGALVTWVSTALLAYLVLHLTLPISILLGAILVVSGPTVVIPLLRHVRANRQVDSILKWEGIVIDPIGAMLAVLVFEAIVAGGFQQATLVTLSGLLKTIAIGAVIGGVGAVFLVLVLRRYWVPDFLQNPITLTTVVAAFAGSNALQHESGLLAVTVMGIVLANQQAVNLKHIVEFKENLRVLLISSLFVLLAARLTFEELGYLGWNSILFLGGLLFLVRPLTILASTYRSNLNWRERLFLAWMCPRGIVAAAVSSVFAIDLAKYDVPMAEQLVPLTFLVIVGTVLIYGLTAGPLARLLGIAKPSGRGILIVGAHQWAREMAKSLVARKVPVLMVDTNQENIAAARMQGLPTTQGSVLSEYVLDQIELEGLGRLLALTSNDEVNSLAALHMVERFGRSEVYQLFPQAKGKVHLESIPQNLQGRLLFAPDVTFTYITERFEEGAQIKTTQLTQEFDIDDFYDLYGEDAIPLFLFDESGTMTPFTVDTIETPQPGQVLLSLVPKLKEKPADTSGKPSSTAVEEESA